MKHTAYETVYETIRQEIVSGVYVYGDRLPGKRTLAEQHGISVITVSHALELLAEEGYIIPRQRSGCYVSYRFSESFAGFSRQLPTTPLPRDPVLTSADVDGIPFSMLAGIMRRVLSEKQESILVKSPNSGIPELRQALSRYLARSREIVVSPEQIFIGAGAEYLYGMIVELLGPELTWAIEKPSYSKIWQVYRARKVGLQMLPLTGDGICSKALQNCTASVLHISPYRSFPSDITASASKKTEYLHWASHGERWIVEDDFESEFSLHARRAETLFSRSSNENVLYLNTFSRTISSALRVGYLVLPQRLLSRWEARCGFYSCTVPAFEQYVLAELIDSGHFERHINRVRRRLRSGQS